MIQIYIGVAYDLEYIDKSANTSKDNQKKPYDYEEEPDLYI